MSYKCNPSRINDFFVDLAADLKIHLNLDRINMKNKPGRSSPVSLCFLFGQRIYQSSLYEGPGKEKTQ